MVNPRKVPLAMSQAKLEDLLIDEEGLNEGLLAGVLAPYVNIGDESGAFAPTTEFKSLDTTQQTVVALLYQRAAHELDFVEQEGASPSEIAESTGINHNSVKTAVRNLDELGLVVNDGGEYSIPPYNFDQAEELIEGE
jgi:predicted transcriptional regulator